MSTSAKGHAAVILSAILYIVCPTTSILELGLEFDGSNQKMIFLKKSYEKGPSYSDHKQDEQTDGRMDRHYGNNRAPKK